MSAPRPLGRRPGDPESTKRDILDAARSLFAKQGFDKTTIRAIAARADVDPALVIHHFGSKQDLFAAAHEIPFSPSEFIGTIAAAPLAERGERLTRMYLEVLGVPGSPAFSLLRAAATNEAAAAMMREFVRDVLIRRSSELAAGPDPELRVALVGTHLIGLVFARNIVGIEALAVHDIDDLVAAVAPTIQRYLEGAAGQAS